jgi:putative ABC transport system permease protein
VAERRLRVVPAVSFGALSLVVAFVGVFGTLARSVAERRREIAIRMAMGASPHRALRMVVRQAAVLAAVAVVTGLAAAMLAARGLASMLYGVTSHDPLTFVVVALIVAVTALVACLVPARRASRVNPIELLQSE